MITRRLFLIGSAAAIAAPVLAAPKLDILDDLAAPSPVVVPVELKGSVDRTFHRVAFWFEEGCNSQIARASMSIGGNTVFVDTFSRLNGLLWVPSPWDRRIGFVRADEVLSVAVDPCDEAARCLVTYETDENVYSEEFMWPGGKSIGEPAAMYLGGKPVPADDSLDVTWDEFDYEDNPEID